jgi:type VI protein secretion system component VasF
MTGFVPVMWMIWGALVLIMLALKVYNDRLSRDEDDQLVLADAFEHVKTEQAAMMARVHKFAPVRRVALVLVAAMTLFIIGYYALDVFNQFK